MGKDENNIKKSFWRYVLISTALCLLFLLLKKDNLLRWIQTGFTLNAQQRKIEALIEDNAHLDSRIQNLSTNKDSLEKFAREEYGFCAPGEDVFLW